MCFKKKKKKKKKKHPYRFSPWYFCHEPKPRDYYKNAPTEALHSLTLVSRISESSVDFVMLLNCLQFETLQMSFWMKMFIFSSIYSDCP